MSGFDHPSVAETHVSYIFFVGDRAYKVKKPVNPGFLDFSTLALRKAACEREVQLNRRFAPDVYEGLATMLGPDGEPCEYLVVMKRMDPARRLSALVRSEEGAGDCLRAVAAEVARFHEDAPAGDSISAAGRVEKVGGRWENNFEEIEAFSGKSFSSGQLDAVRALVAGYLTGRDALFSQRVSEGRIRDVHGDLLADDIYCYSDGPRILDCIEFDDSLRYIDVVDDAAFLAMDLERLAGTGPAERFLAHYREATPDEAFPPSLVDHYIAYRALVRAKVASIRYDQGDEAAGDQAQQLMGMCEAHLRKAQVSLVVVGGLPGTGKSTLARGLAEARGWAVLRSDVVRKELFGSSPGGSGFKEGNYTEEATSKVYEEMVSRAGKLLGLGRPAVLDASFASTAHRRLAAQAARDYSSPLIQLRCTTSPEVAAERIKSRLAEGADASEATPQVAEAMAASADEWPEAAGIDTSGSVERSVEAALRAIEERLGA
ncbi:MAG: AAA family ATPase [Actinomycetota bacterium]